jgi:stress-induced morphogen
MADAKLKRRIRDFFRREFVSGPDESVRVKDGYGDNIHVEVVSHKFDDLGMWKSEQLINALMCEHLPHDVWKYISLTEAFSPEPNGRPKPRRRPKRD